MTTLYIAGFKAIPVPEDPGKTDLWFCLDPAKASAFDSRELASSSGLLTIANVHCSLDGTEYRCHRFTVQEFKNKFVVACDGHPQ
jgi:hypothetical protein